MNAKSTSADTEEALWAEAVSYMKEHGDRWADRAMANFQILIHRQDLLASEAWMKVVDKMIELAEEPKQ
jgi:hypothetical protein